MAGITRTWRLKHNITQEKVAEICQCSRWLVSQWENGKASPTIDHLQRLADVFQCTVADILSGDATAERRRASKISRP